MFTKVLIGIDGRAGGRDAIALGRLLVGAGAEVTLVHVCPPFFGRGAAEAVEFDRAKAQTLLEHERAFANADAKLIVTGPRPVGRGLHELAEDLDADLVVIGATHHHLIARMLIGDDADAALTGTPCAIALAPAGYSLTEHHLRHLGVGYDASAESELALMAAREIATRDDGEITLLWVISPEDVHNEKPIPADWPTATEDLMDRHLERLAAIKGVQGVVASGGPREALAEFGHNLDLLIVGSRGHGAIGRLFHGTIPSYLARHAACPVLVVPSRGAAAIVTPRSTPAEHAPVASQVA